MPLTRDSRLSPEAVGRVGVEKLEGSLVFIPCQVRVVYVYSVVSVPGSA